MGNYVFDTAVLVEALGKDAADRARGFVVSGGITVVGKGQTVTP
jgi:hypothetical protein